MINDYCEFFRNIEKAPEKIVSGLTIRDVYNLRDHLVTCDACFQITENMLANAPPQTFMDIAGEN